MLLLFFKFFIQTRSKHFAHNICYISNQSLKQRNMKKYICEVCEYVYNPEIGDSESCIDPGTAFEDLPDDWVCPVCGVGKEDFKADKE